jgi:hypothetical protein
MEARPCYVAMWAILAISVASVLTYYRLLHPMALAGGILGLAVGALREYWPGS